MTEKRQQVVDTSAWIEWVMDSQIGDELEDVFPMPDECIVPTMVLLELARWLHRENNGHLREEVMTMIRRCLVKPMDAQIAELAAQLGRTHSLNTSDSVIYATARHLGAGLLTCDSDFKDLPDVKLFEKTAAALAAKRSGAATDTHSHH